MVIVGTRAIAPAPEQKACSVREALGALAQQLDDSLEVTLHERLSDMTKHLHYLTARVDKVCGNGQQRR